eukprot:TRINITY_DN4052_c0_g1_i1.p1 TRINITY_DN4052_c0_g1~~TRINITY_DN4052_c0_g1_i1.p1  ORF type:complete len:197 (+),score=13.54 TRINITY_DN4052_c0_g1_i1:155-745(+)
MPRKSARAKHMEVKKIRATNDPRLPSVQKKNEKKLEEKKKASEVKNIPVASSSLFFQYNSNLGPPYRILLDTNFINFSVRNKLDIVKSAMDCLLAKCVPCLTDCVLAELEKLGPKFRVALRIAKDPRIERLICTHAGTYADDCLVRRVEMHKIYIIATCDKDLKRRLRKIPGVPIMYISQRRYTIERLPDVNDAPA